MSARAHRRVFDAQNAFAAYLRGRVPAQNPVEAQRLSIALYRLLGRGRPVSRQDLADAEGLPLDRIETFLRDVLPSAIGFDDCGAIVAFSGLSQIPTCHRFLTEEAELYTWCAFDALFLPEILGKPATLVTHCPGSGAELTVALVPGEIDATQPSGCVLSIVAPDAEACCTNLRAAFCDHVSLFWNERTFRAWSKGRTDIGCVTLEEAELFARRRNALRYPDIDFSAVSP